MNLPKIQNSDLVFVHFIQNANLIILFLFLCLFTVLIIFFCSKVTSLFSKCGSLFYKFTYEWVLMPFFVFLVPITIFTIIDVSKTNYATTLEIMSFILAGITFIGLLIAIIFACFKIFTNKNKLTLSLFQYQSGFLYSIFKLQFPHYLYYTFPLIIFICCSILMGLDYPEANFILGTWAAFVASLTVLLSKIILRNFKSKFMNICEILLDLLFCLMWIPLLIKVHQQQIDSPCSGNSFILDLLFSLLAMLWVFTSLAMLVLYLIRKRKQKANDYTTEEKSNFIYFPNFQIF